MIESRAKHGLQTVAMEGNIELAAETEPSIPEGCFQNCCPTA
jgi:hypothetical protein